MSTAIAWHYTHGRHWPSIDASGVLRRATLHVPANERPCVWFTTSNVFEATALPASTTLGKLSALECAVLTGGLYRVGVALSSTTDFATYKRTSGVKAAALRHLMSAAAKLGTTNGEVAWRVRFDDVPAQQWIAVQRSMDGTSWTDVERVDAMATR